MFFINKKELGQVFTPQYIVERILNDVGYISGNIIGKKIIEPSFGNGVFLNEVLKRLIYECKENNFPPDKIKKEIENNIYGIEIDKELFGQTLTELNNICSEYEITNIKWNLYNSNTLNYKEYELFDFVIGNPPYVRVHNLDESTRRTTNIFEFSNGMKELYIIFFEIGIKLLNKTGKLGFISPNSFLKNTSQKQFRNYLIENNLISEIIDFGSEKIFKDADTYTCITILEKNKEKYSFIYQKGIKGIKNKLKNSDYLKKDKPWNLCMEKEKVFLDEIKMKKDRIGTFCNVQYGIATNKDSVYIGKVKECKENCKCILFNNYVIEKSILRPIIKGSRADSDNNQFIIFPYKIKDDNCYEPINENEMKNKYPYAYKYLSDKKEELMKRDMDANAKMWYQFARSQGIGNSDKEKIVVKQIISNESSTIAIRKIDKKTIVYSGIFITVKDKYTEEYSEIMDIVVNALNSKDFCKYCKLIGKDMSGGYKSITAKDIAEYGIDSIGFE